MRFWRLLLTAAVVSAAVVGLPVSVAAASVPQPIVIGALNFPEDLIVAYLYSDILQHAGFQTDVSPDLGGRSVVEAALVNGQLDIEPDYAGSLLLFLDPSATKAAGQIIPAVTHLKALLAVDGATVLNPAPAVDDEEFAVTRATAEKYHLSTVSSLKKVAPKFLLGTPGDCSQLPTCLGGLAQLDGLHFAHTESLDEGGPASLAALKEGQVQVVELFSSNGTVGGKDVVTLTDDKHRQPADHVIPVIRKSLDTPKVAAAINAVSAKLTTDQLSKLNIAVNDDDVSPSTAALKWLSAAGLI